MATTAHIVEYFDEPKELEERVEKLCELVKQSNHFIVFTGAGISTSTGIPDYRGPNGVWTLAAKGIQCKPQVSITRAVPSVAHMGLVALQSSGIMKFLVSQNCDGLHRRSGIDPGKLSELHGNNNLEKCLKCKKEYLRDFDTTEHRWYNDNHTNNHYTGRQCTVPGCGGDLIDSIVNFGENLPADTFQQALEHASKADLCLVLGSSLTVAPASNIPKLVAERGQKLVIVNLQKTPLDHLSHLRIFARCDTVVEMLMTKLNIPIPPFILHRRLVIEKTCDLRSKLLTRIRLYGLDFDGIPFEFIKRVEMKDTSGVQLKEQEGEPYNLVVDNCSEVIVKLHFWKHYDESELELKIDNSIPSNLETCCTLLQLSWNPANKEWSVTVMDKDYRPPQNEMISAKSACGPAEPTVNIPSSIGFLYSPKEDCPHVQELLAPQNAEIDDEVYKAFTNRNHCNDCHDDGENWLCLVCNGVFCSRYKNAHMLLHFESNSKRCLALSFSDISTWCYKCDSYITHPLLYSKLNALHLAKFQCPMPNISKTQ